MIKVGVRAVDPGLLSRDFFIYFMLRLRDGRLSFLASLHRLVMSVHGIPLCPANILGVVFRAAAPAHWRRGPTVARHWRYRTTTRLHHGLLDLRRWAALGSATVIFVLVTLGLHSRNSEAQ
jgi:hypothetical protein